MAPCSRIALLPRLWALVLLVAACVQASLVLPAEGHRARAPRAAELHPAPAESAEKPAQAWRYCLRARWMDPSTGRFVSEDPYRGDLEGPTSLHRYVYANESPISWSDPSGEFSTFGELAASMAINAVLDASIGWYKGERTLEKVSTNLFTGAVTGGFLFGAGNGIGILIRNSKLFVNTARATQVIEKVSPTVAELRSLGGVKGFQVHHILPEYLGKMLKYEPEEMLGHPGTFISSQLHQYGPNSFHKLIREVLPWRKGVTYTAQEIAEGLEIAYLNAGRPDLFNAIAHLIVKVR